MEGWTDEHVRWRIAHLTTSDISLALLLSTELAEAVKVGHEVIGISAPGPYVDRVTDLGVRHVPIPELTRSWDLRQDLKAFWTLWRTLRSLNLDVLHTHNPKTGVMGRIAGRLARVPVVVNTCHGLWATPQDSWSKRAFVYGLEGLATRFSDYELFQNAEDERTLRRFLKPGRHRVVGNGVDLERFRFNRAGRVRLRTEWGVADDEVLVGTVGRRVAEKGMAEYAAAASALSSSARFVWVGPSDDTAAPADTDLSAVQFIDEQLDMPSVYSALDVFVLASHREGFSRASMEAAACARPLVLSDIRGCREIGRDGEHLRLVPAPDPSALTSTLADLIPDTEQRDRLGTAAFARARQEFDQRAVARRSFATYDDVARGKGLQRLRRDRRTMVLHVLPQDRRRGAQVYAGQLRDRLADRPSQRHIALTLFDGPEGALRPEIRLSVPETRARRLVDPCAVHRLRNAIRRLRPDVVVAHGGEPLKYVIPSADDARIVYYKVGLSTSELQRPLRRTLFGVLARRAERAIAVSADIAEQLEDVLGVPQERLSIIPNGRDPDVYHPGLRATNGQGSPLILFVGELEPGKRPGLFLDVVAEVRRAGIETRAAMAGDGPLKPLIERRAADLGVDVLGTRSDVPDLLRETAVVVVTSAPDTEGMPGIIVEAGLSGVPVVATAAAGVRDVIVSGVTGVVTPGQTAQDLATRVIELLTGEDDRKRMGEAARQRCLEHFSLASSAGKWETLIDELTGVRAFVSSE